MLTTVVPVPEGKIAVAFSGGSDSLALLWGLHTRGEVTALYVNHHIRPEAELERELGLNTANCRRLGVPLVVLDVDPEELEELKGKMGMEGAARTLRYRLLFAWCREHHASLAVAHTKDDQRENVVFRMLLGASASHLAIAGERVVDGVLVFRPLLGSTHEELRGELRARHLFWSEDSTNADQGIARNQLRHVLLPALVERYPELPALLDTLAAFSRMLRHFIDSRIAPIDSTCPLPRDVFLALPGIARDELLYRFLSRAGRVPLSFITRIRTLLEGGGTRWRERLGTCSIWFDAGLMHVEEMSPVQEFCYWGHCLTKGGTLSLPSLGTFHARPQQEGDPKQWIRIDPSVLANPVLRSAREGDRIELFGKQVGIAHLASGWKLKKPVTSIPLLEDRGGIVAVFGSAIGGRDRIATACKSLARRNLFVYYWD